MHNGFATHADLTSDVHVGVLSGTTGEARLLELTGLVAANGVLAEGTRVETPLGTVVADGTAAFMITAANATPNMAGPESSLSTFGKYAASPLSWAGSWGIGAP